MYDIQYALILGLVMGLGGTMLMDIWALLLNRFAGMALPNWGAVGRWVLCLPKVFHNDISTVEQKPSEVQVGWVFHYAVGIAYGLIFVLIAGQEWIEAPSFIPLWLFAIVTIAAGWFFLQPGLGLGWALSKTDAPWEGRIWGLVAHTVFGIGMWIPVYLITLANQ